MAQVVRPLVLSPAAKWPLRCFLNSLFNSKNLPFPTGDVTHSGFYTGTGPILMQRKSIHHSRSRGLRPADAPSQMEFSQSDSEQDTSDVARRSRNAKKREARRSVRWGMELAAFNYSQIKRILRVVSLEEEVFDALMLVKRLGRDVREGKRRQFSYIGRLLREVEEPEMMEGLIQATKDGDQQKFQELSGSDKLDLEDNDEKKEEISSEDEEEGFGNHHEMATRWFDGLVNKDVDITNEIYSLSTVEFDRQELRRLVRKVNSMQETYSSSENDEGKTDPGLLSAKRSLTRFLLTLAKQLPTEENLIS